MSTNLFQTLLTTAKALIAGAALSYGASATAGSFENECSNATASFCNTCDSHYAFKVEYLCFQPLLDNEYFTQPDYNGTVPLILEPGGKRVLNDFDYESGYRLSAIYYSNDPCAFIDETALTFAYLPSSHHKRVNSNTFPFITNGAPANIDAIAFYTAGAAGYLDNHHSLDYYAGDFTLNHPLITKDCFKLSVQTGLHYAWMDYKQSTVFSVGSGNRFAYAKLNENGQTSGIGPQIGALFDYRICKWMNLAGFAKGGLLFARSTAHLKESSFYAIKAPFEQFPTISGDNQKLWRMLPFWQARLSANFNWCPCGYAVNFEIGYEFLSYPDFIDRIQYFEKDVPAISKDIYSTASFQGPFVSLTVGF